MVYFALSSDIVKANTIGIELFKCNLHQEALFHFQISLEKLMTMREKLSDAHSYSDVTRCQCKNLHLKESAISFVSMTNLGEPAHIMPLIINYSNGIVCCMPISEITYSWIGCAAMSVIHNSTLALIDLGRTEDAQRQARLGHKIWNQMIKQLNRVEMLYQDDHIVTIAMSFHILLGKLLLENAINFIETSGFFEDEICRSEELVEYSVLEFSAALDLARKWFCEEKEAKNSIFIARVLSWLGYAVCFLDSRFAYQVYKSSEQLYNSFRQELYNDDGTHCTYTEIEINSLSKCADAA